MISIEIHAEYFSDISGIIVDENEIKIIESAGFDGDRLIRLVVDNSKTVIEKIKDIIAQIYEKDVITGIVITKDKVEIGRINKSNLAEIQEFISTVQNKL